MSTFWTKIEEGLAGQFNLRALSAAFMFWGVGVLLWGLTNGWSTITSFLMKLDVTQAIILAVVLLFLLELTDWVGNWLKLPLLQFLEGYWRWPLRSLSKWLTGRVEEDLRLKRIRLDELANKEDDKLTEEEKKEFNKLEVEIDRYPEEKEYLLPSRLGNLLRSSEIYPYRVYGLEILTIFPRLWLILPESVQKEVSEARENLDNQVKMIMLGIALCLWVFLAWWIILFGFAIAVLGYWRAINAAEGYSLMLRATFDLYRFDLYQKLHLPSPGSPSEEIEYGVNVTQALARGLKSKDLLYRNNEK